MSYVAIIPARGGSKRIPRKNIRPFVGKPIIAWSIQAALESALFERVIVSTDDPEIAATVERYGAEAPFLRPPELSDDRAATTPVVAHALKWLIESGANPSSTAISNSGPEATSAAAPSRSNIFVTCFSEFVLYE